MDRVCHSPLFVSNIFSQYLIWLPGPQGLQKHKNLCCQTCIKVPSQPMSVSHYSCKTALRGQLLCLSSTPYCTRYQAYWHYFEDFLHHLLLSCVIAQFRPHMGWVGCFISPFLFQTYSAGISFGYLAHNDFRNIRSMMGSI